MDSAALLEKEEEYLGKKKTSFWASETEIMAFDIYHRWKGTPPTNPITEEKLMMLKMRKLTEEAVVHLMRRSGKVIDKWTNDERCLIKWGPHKVPISGYPDLGVRIDGEDVIVEIKTYYGNKAQSDVSSGRVKTAYLKQLAIYLYHWKLNHGILLLINQGTGQRYEFELYNEGKNPYHFICPDNAMEINLEETFQRYEQIYVDYVLPDIEPPIDYQYKYDIHELKWDAIPASKIGKARQNKAVIGDWQILYSDFKDMIVEKQGTCLGYSKEELAFINEATAGYTAKRSGKVRFDPNEL